jgi:flagellar biosynthesis regulator FlaF
MDKLEKHIKSIRESMDIHEPDRNLWNRIEKDLPAGERRLRAFLWKAAAVIIVIGAGLTLVYRSVESFGLKNNPEMRLVRETDIYYNNLIISRYEEAEPMLTSNPDVKSELTDGMNELDSLSMQIRKDLRDRAANREVIEALIHNYRLRIELLEDMLSVMREAEQTNNPEETYEL